MAVHLHQSLNFPIKISYYADGYKNDPVGEALERSRLRCRKVFYCIVCSGVQQKHRNVCVAECAGQGVVCACTEAVVHTGALQLCACTSAECEKVMEGKGRWVWTRRNGSTITSTGIRSREFWRSVRKSGTLLGDGFARNLGESSDATE